MPSSRSRLLPALLLGAFLVRASADETPIATPSQSGLEIRAEGEVTDVNTLGGEEIRLRLSLSNPTDHEIRPNAARLFLGMEGGWLVLMDPAEAPDGPVSFLSKLPAAPPGAEVRVGEGEHALHAVRQFPATHAILSLRASDGHAESLFPLARRSKENGSEAAPVFEKPVLPPRSWPFGVGLVGPVESVLFSDGQRSLVLLGQHQCFAEAKPEQVRTEVLVADAAGSLQPVVWEGLGELEDLSTLWPFVRRIDMPASFTNGLLKVKASAVVGGQPVSFEAEWPVRSATPVELNGPVLGTWQLGNGPGQSDLHANYRSPERRYAYDFSKVENGRTSRGDPARNESYFAFGKEIRAAEDGKVVDICETEPDVSGVRATAAPCHMNRVVLMHGDDLYSVYLNVKQNSVSVKGIQKGGTVRRGQTIGQIGNNGGEGSEPHLRFLAFRIGPTGHAHAVPVLFRNAYEDAAGTTKVEGVPVGGRLYRFLDRPGGGGR